MDISELKHLCYPKDLQAITTFLNDNRKPTTIIHYLHYLNNFKKYLIQSHNLGLYTTLTDIPALIWKKFNDWNNARDISPKYAKDQYIYIGALVKAIFKEKLLRGLDD